MGNFEFSDFCFVSVHKCPQKHFFFHIGFVLTHHWKHLFRYFIHTFFFLCSYIFFLDTYKFDFLSRFILQVYRGWLTSTIFGIICQHHFTSLKMFLTIIWIYRHYTCKLKSGCFDGGFGTQLKIISHTIHFLPLFLGLYQINWLIIIKCIIWYYLYIHLGGTDRKLI